MQQRETMRLGGPVFAKYSDPHTWIEAVKELGYRAVYCPVSPDTDDSIVRAYATAAKDADIVIAEVGAWHHNPLSPDPETRHAALEHCKNSLHLAERIGARCCVTVAGSRGDVWDAPAPANLTAETFDMIIDIVRDIVDSVQPTRAFFTLEPMP